MNGKTAGNRGLRRTGALAGAAAVAVLMAGCGMVHVSFGGSSSTGQATFRDDLAYARCMQTHGLPRFPDPTRSHGGISYSISVNTNPSRNGPAVRAYDACKHLLPRGSATTG